MKIKRALRKILFWSRISTLRSTVFLITFIFILSCLAYPAWKGIFSEILEKPYCPCPMNEHKYNKLEFVKLIPVPMENKPCEDIDLTQDTKDWDSPQILAELQKQSKSPLPQKRFVIQNLNLSNKCFHRNHLPSLYQNPQIFVS